MSNKSQVSFCFTGEHRKDLIPKHLSERLNDLKYKITTVTSRIYKIYVTSSEPAFNTLRVCRHTQITAMYDESETCEEIC